MKLVDDVAKAWRWFSVQVFALVTFLPIVWMEAPPEVKALIPPAWLPYIVAAMGVIGMIGRLVKQGRRP